jgi:hypothetical protein
MSTKTLRKRIALVAVSALGFGLLSAAPSKAVMAVAIETTFAVGGTTTAVSAQAGALDAASSAGADDIYVRSGASAHTFKLGMTSVTTSDVVFISMTSGTAAPTAASQQIDISCDSVGNAGGGAETISNTAGDMDVDGSGSIAASVDTGCSVTVAGTAIADLVFTTPALAAGNYSVWASAAASQAADTYKIADVVSYNVGAPTTVSYDHVGRTIVAASAPATSAFEAYLYDSAGRSTFLVGDEVLKHAYSTVASGVQGLAAVSDNTAASTPALTGVDFAGYAVTMDTNGSAGDAPLTAGVTYTLNTVIQNGVNAFGSDTVTTRWISSTNGLTGTLTFRSSVTLATVSSISLANGDGITTGYQLRLTDSTGAVVEGVTPTVSSAARATTAQAGTTSAAGLTTASNWTYTAPGTGTSDTVSFSVSAGSSASITTSVAIALSPSYATASYDGAIAVTANGGRVASGTQSNTSRVDLSGGDAVYNYLRLNPADTTTVTVTYTLLNNAAPKLPVSGATLSFAFQDPGTTSEGQTDSTSGTYLASAARTLSATSVTTGADGKASVTATLVGPRNGEDFRITVRTGGTLIGYADFLFTTAAVAIGTVSAGPAATITQGAGLSTAVTLTALNQYSQAVPGTRIQISVTGPSAPSAAPILTTGADGTATYTVAGTLAVAGQSDIVTITNLNGGSAETAGADDVVTINYQATAPVAGSIRKEYDLSQATSWTNNAVTAIATAIKANNVVANEASLAGAAGTALLGTSSLPIDTLGNWTDSATASGANGAAYDETVALRFTVLTAGGTAIAGIPVVLTATAGAWMVSSASAATASRTRYTDANGQVTYTVFATKTGDATFTVTSGGATDSITINYANVEEDARFITVGSATANVTSGKLVPLTAIVTDRYGNPVSGVTVSWTESGDGRFEGTPTTTNASGISTADFSAAVGETGTATVKTALGSSYEQRDDFAGYVDIVGATAQATSSYTTSALGLTAAAEGVGSASTVVTLVASTDKSAELLASEANAAAIAAIAAKAASDKAETDAKIKLLEAQIAASQAAAVAAAEAAADAAAEAIDAGNNAFDAATSAGEAADAATAAAEQAGEDATAAATAAGEAAVAAAEAAQEAAAEATDAANAATDAANASAEAADAATAAAQDAADAVAALSTQVSEMISALKKQITSLTNLVIKIQKKVKA